MIFYDSSNPVLVDSPFAKMLTAFPVQAQAIGIPPVSKNHVADLLPEYAEAARALDLDSSDPEFVARRVRHLAHIIRHSKFADRINWRSYLEHVDNLLPIVDEPQGLTSVSGLPSNCSYTLLNVSTPAANQTYWGISVTGTFNGSSGLVLKVNSQHVASFGGRLTATPIGASGYTFAFTSGLGTGDSINFSAVLRVPYSGNCAAIYSSLKSKPEMVRRILRDNQEYSDVFFNGDCVEDAIAAFLLAVDDL